MTKDSEYRHRPEASRAFLSRSGVVFLGLPNANRQEALRQQRITVIPWEMSMAGAALDTLITTHPTKGDIFAHETNLPHDTLGVFRQGGTIVNLNRVYADAVSSFRKEGAEQLSLIDRFRQGQNWLRTFTQDDMDIARATEFILLNSGLHQSEFANNANVSDSTLTFTLNGDRFPLPSAANGFLKAGGIHTDSMAAHYYRLACRKRQPMSIDELLTIPLGKLIQNLRFMKGLEVEELGDLLDYKKDAMKAVEAGNSGLKESALAPLIALLGLPNDSAIEKIITQKYEEQPKPNKPKIIPQPIPEGIIEDVLYEPYLFQEHVDQIKTEPYPLTKEDDELKSRLEQLDSVSKMLKAIRESNGLTLSQVSEQTGLAESNISSTRYDSHVPESYNILFILRGISECSGVFIGGYDVHHPITQLILNQAEKERNAKAEETEAATGIKRRTQKRKISTAKVTRKTETNPSSTGTNIAETVNEIRPRRMVKEEDLTEGEDVEIIFIPAERPDNGKDDSVISKPARHPILKKRQEAVLFGHLRAGHSVDDLLFDLEFLDPTVRATEQWQEIQRTSDTIENVLLACNRGSMINMARKFYGRPLAEGVEFGPLLSSAQEGMLEAMKSFDPTHTVDGKTVTFLTYAKRRMEWSIRHFLIKEQEIDSATAEAISFTSFLSYAFGKVALRYPVETELREQLLYHSKITPYRIEQVMNFFSQHSLLHYNTNIGEGTDEMSSTMTGFSNYQEADIEARSLQRAGIFSGLRKLPELHQQIICDRYGLTVTGEALTPQELAIKYHMPLLRVTYILSNARNTLKKDKELAPLGRGRIMSDNLQEPVAFKPNIDEESIQAALAGNGMLTVERTRILSHILLAAEIASICGVGSSRINQIQNKLKRDGKLTYYKRAIGESWQPHIERITELYYDGLTHAEIAEVVSVPQSSIENGIKKLISEGRLVKRNPSWAERIMQSRKPSDEVAKVGKWFEDNTKIRSPWQEALELRNAA